MNLNILVGRALPRKLELGKLLLSRLHAGMVIGCCIYVRGQRLVVVKGGSNGIGL